MDRKSCENSCMFCRSGANLYNVNNSKIHKICRNCSLRLSTVNYSCQICQSSINIEFLKPAPIKTACQKCNSPHGVKCASKHYFCQKCRIGGNCPGCICYHCHTQNEPLQGCKNHSICSNCTTKLGEVCVYCFCVSCGKTVQDNYFLNCKHPACLGCVNCNKCKLCERMCFYCNNRSIFTGSTCDFHFACQKCNEDIVSKLGCLWCKQKTIEHKCIRCTKLKAKILQHCNTIEHRYCTDCTQISAKCDFCNSCAGCGLSYPVTKGKCSHMFCKNCQKKNSPCNICRQPSTKCSRCSRPTDKAMLFNCNMHNACYSCLSTNEPCKNCTKNCESCEKFTNEFTDFNCSHYFCKECLTIKKCLKCFPSNPISLCVYCKKASNLVNLTCIHTQQFCNPCFSTMGSCILCKLCKGCLKKKGKILNDSKHLVCRACFENGKCCRECDLVQKCSFCSKKKNILVQFFCNFHKGCLECKSVHKIQQCSVCNLKTCTIKSLNCSHSVCENCLEKTGSEMCLKCLPKCLVCNKPAKKNSTCAHNICEECNRGNSDCGLCSKLIPNYCKTCATYRFFLSLDCKKHKCCGFCMKNTSVCPECPSCTICKKQTAGISSIINDSQEIPLCEQCKPNYTCSKCSSHIFFRKFDCNHALCSNCAPQNLCTICNSICKICHVNFNTNNTCIDICLGCRNIFNGCIFCSQTDQKFKCNWCQRYEISVTEKGNSLTCQDCYTKMLSTCHICNKVVDSGQKSNICGLTICDNCNKYLSFPVCPACNHIKLSSCTNCNNLDYCVVSICMHPVCLECSTQKCRLCAVCSVCEKPGEKSNKCGHRVCYSCYLESGCFYCNGYLKCEEKHWYLNQFDDKGCPECTKFRRYSTCKYNFMECEIRDGICLRCGWGLCGSCKNNKRVITKECGHFECEECIVDERSCARCCELYKCKNHNQSIYRKMENTEYYYAECCTNWICLKCRKVYSDPHLCSNSL